MNGVKSLCLICLLTACKSEEPSLIEKVLEPKPATLQEDPAGVDENPKIPDRYPASNPMVLAGEPKIGWDILLYPKVATGGFFTLGFANSPEVSVCGQCFKVVYVIPGNRLPIHIPNNPWLVGKEVLIRHFEPPPPNIIPPTCGYAKWTQEFTLWIEAYP